MNVVITGANRGIGLALTQAYRRRGDTVFAVVRNTSSELSDTGANVISGIDITQPDDMNKLQDALADVAVDTLILNAGLLRRDAWNELSFSDIHAQLEVNSVAPLRVTAALSPRMVSGGKIAIVTSRMGSMADNTSGGYYGYRMSKAAVNACGVSLARDLAPRNISVVMLHPGFVRTEMTGSRGDVSPEESAAGLVARIDETNQQNTGRFVHANGTELPW